MVPSDRQVLLAIQAHRGNQGRRENPDHRVNKDRRVKQELQPIVRVGSTTTSEPGTPADVSYVETPDGIELNFIIPRGDTGPGGGGGGLLAYGGKYNDSAQTLNLLIGAEQQLPLPVDMPASNVDLAPVNALP